MFLLFVIVIGKLRMALTARWVDCRPKFPSLMFPLSTGYFFHIRTLRSSFIMVFLFNSYLVIGMRYLALAVLVDLDLSLSRGAKLTYPLILVIVGVVILREH